MSKKTSLDSWVFPFFFVPFIYESISGLYLYLGTSFTIPRQFSGLSHIIFGFLFLVPCVVHQTIHFIQAWNAPRRFSKILGYTGFGTIIISLISGIWWTLVGTRADNYWLIQTHLAASIIALLISLSHIGIFIYNKREWRLINIFYPKSNLIFGIGMAGIILILSFSYKPVEYINGTPKGYNLKYGDNPFYPSETMTSTGGIIDARMMGNSKSCGVSGCHKEIYDQWYSSAHRWSSTDVFYKAAENYMRKTEGVTATRYCGGCHDPIALLAGDMNPGKGLDTPYSDEGSSCIVCHSTTAIRHLRGSGSFLFTPPERYIYEDREGIVPVLLSNLVISSDPSLHKKTFTKDFLKNPEYCAVCHKQFITKDINHWGWMKLQDQYGPWLASRFSGRNSKGFFSDRDIRTCNSCHMPLVKSDDPSAGDDGMVRSHRFVAANTAVPWLDGDKVQFEKTVEWMKRREIFLDIYEPRVRNGVRGEKFVSQDIYHVAEIAPYVYMGDTLELQIASTNVGVGHHFPDGPIDIYESWIEVKATDSQGKIVFWSGKIADDGNVDEDAHFFRALAVDRYGKLVNKHNLWDMVGSVYSKTIAPGETDIATFGFDIPYWVKGDITVMARLRYRRFNQWYTNWALGRTDVRLPVVDMARDTMTIPVKKKREQEKVTFVR